MIPLPLLHCLQAQNDLAFSVLVGSRADHSARPDSDWDIALRWAPELPWLTRIGRTETLRREIAKAMALDATSIDLIDLADAGLTMRAVVAESGIPLTGEDTADWARYLRRTWRELEDFYWERQDAA